MFMVVVEMILPPAFLTKEQLQEAPSEDLWCEIAECMFYPNTSHYLQDIENELKRRDSISS